MVQYPGIMMPFGDQAHAALPWPKGPLGHQLFPPGHPELEIMEEDEEDEEDTLDAATWHPRAPTAAPPSSHLDVAACAAMGRP